MATDEFAFETEIASSFPVDATVFIDKKGQLVRKTAFFVRTGNSTQELDAAEKTKHVLNHWPNSQT